jgi:hypothetical protein
MMGRFCFEIIKWVFAIRMAKTAKNKPNAHSNRPLGYSIMRKLQVLSK